MAGCLVSLLLWQLSTLSQLHHIASLAHSYYSCTDYSLTLLLTSTHYPRCTLHRLMGNLARAAFPTSTKAVWPWSYDACDGSIPHLANRQEINACLDSPGHGLHPHQGRGSPEIDLFEVNSVPNQPSKAKSNNKNNGDKVAFSSESPAFMR